MNIPEYRFIMFYCYELLCNTYLMALAEMIQILLQITGLVCQPIPGIHV